MVAEPDRRMKLVADWVDRIVREGVNTTAWEDDFINSIQDYLDRGRMLTEKQLDKVERIYTMRVP